MQMHTKYKFHRRLTSSKMHGNAKYTKTAKRIKIKETNVKQDGKKVGKINEMCFQFL